MSSSQTALVTGASGYIGAAVARSFVRAGWHVYGLVRREEAKTELEAQHIVPIIGSPDNLDWLPKLFQHTRSFEVIVSVTEDLTNYVTHYNNIVSMLRSIAAASSAPGVRPLVLFTSGCKDYGMSALHGSVNLKPMTEESPLNPPHLLTERAQCSLRIFENNDLFDASVLRPTTVYGLTSSFYAGAFLRATKAQDGDGTLVIESYAESIVHGCHVDDCGDAYVALAEHRERKAVAGKCFNISARRYETVKEIAEALVAEYDLKGVRYEPQPGTEDTELANFLFAFSEWVDSQRIRHLTGWTDRKPLFAQGLKEYRREYELAKSQGNYALTKMHNRLESVDQK